MKSHPETWGIFKLESVRSKINPKPQYQRGSVWSESKKQLLLDSLLRGYDIPKLYVRSLDGDPVFEYEVVDGQQRIRAILEFIDGQFAMPDESEDIPIHGDLKSKKYQDLDVDAITAFKSFEMIFTVIEKATDEETRELFLRLQEGESLNPAEKRNAMLGNMRNFVEKIVASHGVFPLTTITNKRFEYDDYCAHITKLELNSGPIDLSAVSLKKMYEDETSFDVAGPVAKKVKKVLNYILKAFKVPTPELKIKWGFVDLYLLVSRLIEDYDITNRHDDIKAFYLGFENERMMAQANDPATLLEGTVTSWDRDLYNYIEAFRREGNKRGNVEKRAEVYKLKFLEEYPDLIAKDPARAFNSNERIVIWRMAGEKCLSCSKTVTLTECHADHIKPHSRGGRTSIDNGQCLCSSCNLKKGNKA